MVKPLSTSVELMFTSIVVPHVGPTPTELSGIAIQYSVLGEFAIERMRANNTRRVDRMPCLIVSWKPP